MLTQLSPSTTLWYLVHWGSVLGSRVPETVVVVVGVVVAESVPEDAAVLLVVPIQTASPVALSELRGDRVGDAKKQRKTRGETNPHQGMRSSSRPLGSRCRIG